MMETAVENKQSAFYRTNRKNETTERNRNENNV